METLTDARPARRNLWLSRGLIVVAVVALYGPVARFPFVNWDDQETIAGNPAFNPVSFRGVMRYWSAPHLSLYIPVTYSYWGSVAWVARLTGAGDARLAPGYFHVANALVHLAASLLVFEILRRLARSVSAALVGAMLFAVHPVQVEPIGWISGGKDVLSGALALAAILCFLLFAQRDAADPSFPSPGTPGEGQGGGSAQPTPGEEGLDTARTPTPTLPRRTGGGGRSFRPAAWLIVMLILGASAMLAKPSAVSLPLVLLALSITMPQISTKRATIAVLPLFLLALPIILVGKHVQPATNVVAPPIARRPLVAGDAMAFDLRQVVAPVRLALDYGRSPAAVLNDGATRFIWIVPVGVLLVAWSLRRRLPWLAAGTGVLAAAVLPVLGFVPFEFQQYSTVADHYLYLAMLGPALIAAGVVARRPGRATLAAAAVLLVLLAIRARVQLDAWRNSQLLFQQTLAVNPTSLAANRTLGYLAARDGRPREAIDYYRRALAAHPDDPITHYDLGNLLLAQGRPDLAIDHFAAMVAAKPDHAQARQNLGVALARTGRMREAAAQFAEAVRLDPGNAVARKNLEAALAALWAAESATQPR